MFDVTSVWKSSFPAAHAGVLVMRKEHGQFFIPPFLGLATSKLPSTANRKKKCPNLTSPSAPQPDTICRA